LLAVLSGLGLIGLLNSAAPANTINLVFKSAVYTGVIGFSDVKFTYDVNLTGSSQISAAQPSIATIYDIQGLVESPPSWTFTPNVVYGGTTTFSITDQTPGITPIGTAPVDGPLPNLTLTYTGSNFTATPANTLADGSADGAATLGSFSFISTLHFVSGPNDYFVTSRDETGTGGLQTSTSFTAGPAAAGTPAVPLPASAWGGLGLLGLMGINRARKMMAR
jgi:hypothetical protein